MIIQGLYLAIPALIATISAFVAHKIIETRQVLDNELQERGFNDLEEKTETVPSIEEYKSPKKVKCEYCGSIVDNCTNCPNCGAVLPDQEEAECVELYADDEIIERVKIKR